MTSKEIIDYYADRLILQYRRQDSNARKTIATFVGEVVADLLFLRLANAFDIEIAEGSQLDILAKYIGVGRSYLVDDVNVNYFGFASYNPKEPQNPNGFRDYTKETNSKAIWFQYGTKTETSVLLNDTNFRLFLKFKIIRNTSDNTLPGIMAGIRCIFGQAITVIDNKDMTLTYTVLSNLVPLAKPLLEQVLPRPAGVGINVKIIRTRFAFTRRKTYNPLARNPYTAGFRFYKGNLTGAQFVSYVNYDG